VTAGEALENEKKASKQSKTWRFEAENVRDFAWASSRKFIWDAKGYQQGGDSQPEVMAMSFYPKEGEPLWSKYSTEAVIHTMEVYSRFSFDYPYPVAQSVNGPVGGMEYPMITFNGPRTDEQDDGSRTYSQAEKRFLVGVVIHEVGHIYFPMTVNSDERQWTWMDEGLNSFLQFYGQWDYAKTYCGEQWTQNPECEFVGRMGPAPAIVSYMQDPDQVPLMTESDLIHKDFGNNGYSKPAAGLLMLREHILSEGPFDEAFGGYAKKWMFKKPKPADFFRSMDDGAGEHLAWFWRGWFYTTHANDQALEAVATQLAMDLIGSVEQGQYYHRIQIKNEGGLIMPVELEVTYVDGSVERISLPVDVWRMNELTFTKGFFSSKALMKVVLDPDEAYADIDRSDNEWTASPGR
jgi:aminopeptidase N